MPCKGRFWGLQPLHGHYSCCLVARAACLGRFSAGTRLCQCTFAERRELLSVLVGKNDIWCSLISELGLQGAMLCFLEHSLTCLSEYCPQKLGN